MKDMTVCTSAINSKIHWPGILIHVGHDELVYLENEQDWESQALGHIDPSSQLFDSVGVSYFLERANLDASSQQLIWRVSSEPMTLEQVSASIRRHASTLGHCCTAKLGADTVEQVFAMIKYLEQD